MAKWNQFEMKSYVKAIQRDLDKLEREKVQHAAKYLQGKIRDKIKTKRISQPGEPPGRFSGNLHKGIRYKTFKEGSEYGALVGAGPPAYHAHLLEFGTEERTVNKTGKDAGKVEARPFLLPTFEEEREYIKLMMMERWFDDD